MGKTVKKKKPEPETKPRQRYFMDAAIVHVERESAAMWKVYGPWHEPFRVDNESFKKHFVEI